MKAAAENKIVHIAFGHYVALKDRKIPSRVDAILEMIRSRDAYGVFRNELSRMAIEDETDNDFPASLKDKLDPVEEVRNCVAHNRSRSRRLMENYHAPESDLQNALEEYLVGWGFPEM